MKLYRAGKTYFFFLMEARPAAAALNEPVYEVEIVDCSRSAAIYYALNGWGCKIKTTEKIVPPLKSRARARKRS